MRKKRYNCEGCDVEFDIIVEPNVCLETEVSKNHPLSICWLENIKECPICGCDLEEIT